MALADGLSRLARLLIAQYGEIGVLERTSATDPGQQIQITRDEKPTRLPSQYRQEVTQPNAPEPVYFLISPPLVLPEPYTNPWDWLRGTCGVNTKFTCSGIQYTVKRLIPITPQGVAVMYYLVCNTPT